MKKLFKLMAAILALVMLLTVVAACGGGGEETDPCADGHTYVEGVCTVCGEEQPLCADGHTFNEAFICSVCGAADPTLANYADGTNLAVSIAHDSKKTTISFDDADVVTVGGLTLADGKTYQVGDLKPVWAAVQDELKITFTNAYESGNVQNSYRGFRGKDFAGVDVLLGNAADIAEDGRKGKLVNLADYMDLLPNFSKFLEENPLVLLSIISDTDSGAIYYAPYFDGYDDIERYFLMRSDWVEILLDGEGAFTAEYFDTFEGNSYTPYMPTTGKVVVDAMSKDGASVISLTKDYDAAGNPIVVQNALATKDGVTLVNALRDYIDEAYDGFYGTKRSDLFCGYAAAWDADELVALLRCVTSNTYSLTGYKQGDEGYQKVTGIFPREARLDRESNLLGIATMFGARGLNAAQDYLYFDSEGFLCDARQDVEFYEAVGKLNQLYKEGLILQDFHSYSGKIFQDMYQKNLGFMCYDYCQTQTLFNEYTNPILLEYEAGGRLEGKPIFNLTPVLNPVAEFDDGSDTYFRFTESWRGVKTSGWCINAAVLADKDKLGAALALFDYPWSEAGGIMMTYGPEGGFWQGTTEYKGNQIPKMTEQNKADFVTYGKGNFTNYARQYIGTTFGIGFVKDQGFEYQCTTAGGMAGSLMVGQAIALGIVKHVAPQINEDNMFYTMIPTTLPTTVAEDNLIGELTALTDNFSKSNNKYGCYVDLITNGFGGAVASAATPPLTAIPADAAAFAALVAGRVSDNGMGGETYAYIMQTAWEKALLFYKNITE